MVRKFFWRFYKLESPLFLLAHIEFSIWMGFFLLVGWICYWVRCRVGRHDVNPKHLLYVWMSWGAESRVRFRFGLGITWTATVPKNSKNLAWIELGQVTWVGSMPVMVWSRCCKLTQGRTHTWSSLPGPLLNPAQRTTVWLGMQVCRNWPHWIRPSLDRKVT